jgi:hypothetical protein
MRRGGKVDRLERSHGRVARQRRSPGVRLYGYFLVGYNPPVPLQNAPNLERRIGVPTNHAMEKQQAVEEARRQLQCLPISCDEFGRAADRVLKSDPTVTGQALKDLIVQEALDEWMRGTGHV